LLELRLSGMSRLAMHLEQCWWNIVLASTRATLALVEMLRFRMDSALDCGLQLRFGLVIGFNSGVRSKIV
jgi:hypothetical protein